MKAQRLVASYMAMRRSIGILGMALSGLVVLGGVLSGEGWQPSISQYYWTWSRDILVGTLAIAGALLMTYTGYDRRDNVVTTSAGISAIGIALFPARGGSGNIGYFQLPVEATHVLHVVFTVSFFLLLAFMAYFQFTLGKDERRNRVYRLCGVVIVLALAIIVLFHLAAPGLAERIAIVFWMELVMLLSFGISWLVKGRAIQAAIGGIG